MTRRGLTFIELVIALVVLGLLAAVLFPTFAAARERRNATDCAGNLSQIYRALQLYQADWDGQLPPSNGIDVCQPYGLTSNNFRCPNLPYGLTSNSFQCPNVHWHDISDYEFRLALPLTFDDSWSESTKRKAIAQHPEWLVPEGWAMMPAPRMMRTVVPEPESVLVVCRAHVRHANTWSYPAARLLQYVPARRDDNYYQVLRANGKVERVPVAEVKLRFYKNGKWYDSYSPVQGGDMNYSFADVYPHEPWPPHFRP